MRVRLLPLIIVLSGVALLGKTVEVIQGGKRALDIPAGDVRAADKEEPKKEEKEEEKEDEEKSEEKPAEEATKAEGDAEEKSEKEEDKGLPGAPSPLELSESTEPPTSNTVGGLRPEEPRFSPAEIELLQKLAKRREQLDEAEKNLKIRENLLTESEKRIDTKLSELQTLKAEMSQATSAEAQAEDEKIQSLVKIYESMKPKDAARIFDELEMPVVLKVVSRMPEKKSALILANMDSQKAKQVTVYLSQDKNAKPKPAQ